MSIVRKERWRKECITPIPVLFSSSVVTVLVVGLEEAVPNGVNMSILVNTKPYGRLSNSYRYRIVRFLETCTITDYPIQCIAVATLCVLLNLMNLNWIPNNIMYSLVQAHFHTIALN